MITFLLHHRTKPQLFSRAWVRTWLKRIWTLPPLLGYCLQSLRWRMKGAQIASSTVMAQLTVHGDARNLAIGDCCCLGITRMQTHERIQIGNCVVINDGVRLITGSHDIHSPTYEHVFAPIVIEDHAWIATDAMILKGVTIGRGAVVAAGAVVVKNVRPFSVVGGNPAKEIGSRNIESFNYIPSSWFAPVMAWVGRNPVIDRLEPAMGAAAEPPTISLPKELLPH
ncbi:acyltransferase [Prosthecobacter sp.]|uniref:acyltransferase n=1 Tax=Prosthecobacter sp. TaxID=1965333 RepID=UPI0031F31A79